MENKGDMLEDCKATVKVQVERDMLKQQITDIQARLDTAVEEKEEKAAELKVCDRTRHHSKLERWP